MALEASAEPGVRAVLTVCDGVSMSTDSDRASLAAARAVLGHLAGRTDWDWNLTDLAPESATRMVLDVLGILERGDRVEAAHTLQLFKRDYCSRKLPLGFYREFNSASSFAVTAGSRVFQFDGEAGVDRADLEIAHNLRNVVIPLARGVA